jgi:WD40 repeat protein
MKTTTRLGSQALVVALLAATSVSASAQSTQPEAVFQVGHQRPPIEFTLTTDGGRLIVSSENEGVIIWDVSTWRQLGPIPQAGASPIASSPDGDFFVAGQSLWNSRTGDKLRDFKCDGITYCAKFSPDGRTVAFGIGSEASGGAPALPESGSVGIFDVTNAQPIHLVRGFAGRIKSLTFTPDGKRLAVLSARDSAVVFVDVATGRRGQELELTIPAMNNEGPRVLEVSRDGRRLLAGAGDALEVWAIDEAKSLQKFAFVREESEATSKSGGMFAFEREEITAAAFTPDGKSVVVATGDYGNSDDGFAGSLRQWDITTGRQTAVLT